MTVVGLLAAAVAAGTEADIEQYKKLLQEKGIATTAVGITRHLHEISPTPAMINNIDSLIQQLGAESYKDRRAAQKKLEAMGHLAEAKVRAAAKSKDPEIRARASRLIRSYSNYEANAVLHACVVALGDLEAGSAGVAALLKAAPLYSRPYLARAAEEALQKLAGPEDAATLTAAARDLKSPARYLAVVALGGLLGGEKSSALHPFLQDADPRMVLAAARAVANVGDRQAIPALLRLMQHDKVSIRHQSFALLQQFTRTTIYYSAHANSRERAEALRHWQRWYEQKGKTAKLHFPVNPGFGMGYLNGHTLIALGNGNGGVVELDRRKKEVWRYPFRDCWTAEKLANGNYLIGSHSQEKLVEVTRDKKVVWEYPTKAMGAVQLGNGNVLAATHTSHTVIEIRKRDKQIVWQYNAGADCYKARRLPNGNTLVAGQRFIREVTPRKTVAWEYNEGTYFYSIQPLPGGNIVTVDHSGSIFELNRAKKRVWELQHRSSTGAFKLSNGNVLVAFSGNIKEFTRKGKEVWTYSGNQYGYAHR